MADESTRGEQGGGNGGESTPDRTAGVPIGEDGADDFAPDVAVANDEETGAPDLGVAGSAGGGTGVGDLSGGTGIGTSDGGDDTTGKP